MKSQDTPGDAVIVAGDTNKMILRKIILSIIEHHIGKQYAIKRGELRDQLRAMEFGSGMSDLTFDRRIREAIESLRNDELDGACILSDNEGSGYWAEESSTTEFERYCESEKRRGLSILARVAVQKKRAGVILQGQMVYV